MTKEEKSLILHMMKSIADRLAIIEKIKKDIVEILDKIYEKMKNYN